MGNKHLGQPNQLSQMFVVMANSLVLALNCLNQFHDVIDTEENPVHEAACTSASLAVRYA